MSGDLPIMAALRTRMQWHQERQRVLAENVANSDTPNFKPRELVEPKFDASGSSQGGSLPMMRTSASHIGPALSSELAGMFQNVVAAGDVVNHEPRAFQRLQHLFWFESGSRPLMPARTPARESVP